MISQGVGSISTSMNVEDARGRYGTDAGNTTEHQQSAQPESLPSDMSHQQRHTMVAVLSSHKEGECLPRLERLSGPKQGMTTIVCRIKSWGELSHEESLRAAEWSHDPGVKIWYLPNICETHETFTDPLHPISNRAAIDGYVLCEGCEVHHPDLLGEAHVIVDHHKGNREKLPSSCLALQQLADGQTLHKLFAPGKPLNCNMLFNDIDEDGAWSIAVADYWKREEQGAFLCDEERKVFRELLHAENRMDVTGGSAPDVDDETYAELKYINAPLARERGERKPKSMEKIYDQIHAFLVNVERRLAGERRALPLEEEYSCVRAPTDDEPWAVVDDEQPDARRRMRRDGIALAVIRVGSKDGRHIYSSFQWDANRMPVAMSEMYRFLNRAEHHRMEDPDGALERVLSAAADPQSPSAPCWGGNGAGGCKELGSGFSPQEMAMLVAAFCRTSIPSSSSTQSSPIQ